MRSHRQCCLTIHDVTFQFARNEFRKAALSVSAQRQFITAEANIT
jgi:hypothetical protein